MKFGFLLFCILSEVFLEAQGLQYDYDFLGIVLFVLFFDILFPIQKKEGSVPLSPLLV